MPIGIHCRSGNLPLIREEHHVDRRLYIIFQQLGGEEPRPAANWIQVNVRVGCDPPAATSIEVVKLNVFKSLRSCQQLHFMPTALAGNNIGLPRGQLSIGCQPAEHVLAICCSARERFHVTFSHVFDHQIFERIERSRYEFELFIELVESLLKIEDSRPQTFSRAQPVPRRRVLISREALR